MMNKMPVTILNFSGIYENQSIINNPEYLVIDCKNISGTNGYCDDSAADEIRKILSDVAVNGIHFIDNGNYHYISKFTTERVNTSFTLVVFDHHSDMMEPSFAGLLSCGSWILNSAETNPYIKRIVLIGISEEQKELIPEINKEIIVYTDTEIRQLSNVTFPNDVPVYISIDKDVLSPDELVTSWDQGIIKTEELTSVLDSILPDKELIGVDICGECAPHTGANDDDTTNESFNKLMVEYFQRLSLTP